MKSSNNNGTKPFVVIYLKNACCSLTARHWLKFITNLAIPVVIGIFTIIISIQQQNVAQANRDRNVAQTVELRKENLEKARKEREENKELARLQREEDMKVAHLQREEDKDAARLQRKDDQETARRQREEDRETIRIQRELDLNISYVKRRQEYELAQTQRSLYESRHTHESEIAYQDYTNNLMLEEDRQNDDILISYQRELSALLFDVRMKFGNDLDYTCLFVLQMKTRAALRLLNPTRRTILVQTLFQANLLRAEWRKETSLLYKANVSGVHFGRPPGYYAYDFLDIYNFPDIEQADVRYASFRSVAFGNLPLFTFSNFDYTDWSFSKLDRICFCDKMTMNNAIFAESQLVNVDFQEISMNRASFQRNKLCLRCVFLETSLLGVRLDNSNFVQSTFIYVSMTDGNLSNGSFIDSTFEGVILDRADLSAAKFQGCTFQNVSMVNCSMFDMKLNQTKFLNVNLTGCTGFSYEQIYSIITINQVTLPNGTFLHF